MRRYFFPCNLLSSKTCVSFPTATTTIKSLEGFNSTFFVPNNYISSSKRNFHNNNNNFQNNNQHQQQNRNKKIKSSSNSVSEAESLDFRSSMLNKNSKINKEIEEFIGKSEKNIVLSLHDDDVDHHHHDINNNNAIKNIPPASVWWKDASVLRKSRVTRVRSHSAVVGGEQNIKKIWNDLGVTPKCVFVPDDLQQLPDWVNVNDNNKIENRKTSSKSSLSSTVIVRAPGAEINRDLLSAEHNDGFAAQFELPKRLPREFVLNPPSASSLSSHGIKKRFSRVAVAHGLRIPTNVGSIVKTAYRLGFDSIVLDRCCDLSSEKVLRAAGEAVFDPKFHIFEFGHKLIPGISSSSSESGSDANNAAQRWDQGAQSSLLLKRIAASHRLLPLMLVPQGPFSSSRPTSSYEYNDEGSEQVQDIFSMARHFHYANYKNRLLNSKNNNNNNKEEEEDIGTMLIFGGEAAGLSGLAQDWNRDAISSSTSSIHNIPMIPITIRMDNPQVSSINVSGAATIAMNFFRPKATKEFEEYFKRGIVPAKEVEDEENDENENEDGKEEELFPLNTKRLVANFDSAVEASNRLLG